MSEHEVQPSPQLSTPASVPRTWPWIAAVALALFVGFAVGAIAGPRSSTGANRGNVSATTTPTATSSVRPTAITSTTTAAVVPPAPTDFAIAITVLEKKCFGSAGCTVRYQIKPMYLGTTTFPPGRKYTVIYEVSGGEDPQTNRFTLTGERATFPAEESISTASSSAQLTAKVTGVLDDN